MLRSRSIPVLALLALLAGAAAAQEHVRRIRFAPGARSAAVAGAVLRGERNRYLVGARAGQRLEVSITSPEGNAVFQVIRPGRRGALPGAGEADDARRWSGVLPATGDYAVVVGGTRGNASYRLVVGVR